ncbi:MAG: alanine dehydrogenase [Actinobacteria bacterium]|uniref:alanine dehydrogenase n=1 Tax=freshwater metagenome TaxID=449393 RepID=A0A6J7CS43_9ZZZZ|nr:alanine dehydrogenase [Actinomycetota bacterium]
MIVGIPKEVKINESRVAITPEGVGEFIAAGHSVVIEIGAGEGSAIHNSDFQSAGATMVASAQEVWAQAELVIKVKEPIEIEYSRMRSDQILFTYLHLAASRTCTDALMGSGITAIAYETVEVNGALPLLAPMSEVAGRLATQVGATALQRPNGGRGTLLGGVPGVAPGRVVVIGGGVAGVNAAVIAVGMGADVTVFDRSIARLAYIDTTFGGRIKTLVASAHAIDREVRLADLVIGAVLIHGAKAPQLVSNELVKKMKSGSVLVDIAIDQGGCFEDSRPTTHSDPTYLVHNSIFYCVANMPGAVPVTSTYALTNATLSYALSIANYGWREACMKDSGLGKGINVHGGKIYYSAVAEAHGYQHFKF